MMKEAVRALETGVLSEIGLIAFVLAFVCGCAIAFFAFSKRERDVIKQMPLDDDHILTDDALFRGDADDALANDEAPVANGTH